MFENSQCGKSRLTNLVAFYDVITGGVDEERTVNAVDLDFCKAFDTVSYNVLTGKFGKCGTDEWTASWIVN